MADHEQQIFFDGITDARFKALEERRAKAEDEKTRAAVEKKRAADVAKATEAAATYWGIMEKMEVARLTSLDDPTMPMMVAVGATRSEAIPKETWDVIPPEERETLRLLAVYEDGRETMIPAAISAKLEF